jgi:hypothetical protein
MTIKYRILAKQGVPSIVVIQDGKTVTYTGDTHPDEFPGIAEKALEAYEAAQRRKNKAAGDAAQAAIRDAARLVSEADPPGDSPKIVIGSEKRDPVVNVSVDPPVSSKNYVTPAQPDKVATGIGPQPVSPVLTNTPGGSEQGTKPGPSLKADSNADAEEKSSRYRDPPPSGDSSNARVVNPDVVSPVAPVVRADSTVKPPIADPVAPSPPAPPPEIAKPVADKSPATNNTPTGTDLKNIASKASKDAEKEVSSKADLQKKAAGAAAEIKGQKSSNSKDAEEKSKVPVDKTPVPIQTPAVATPVATKSEPARQSQESTDRSRAVANTGTSRQDSGTGRSSSTSSTTAEKQTTKKVQQDDKPVAATKKEAEKPAGKSPSPARARGGR